MKIEFEVDGATWFKLASIAEAQGSTVGDVTRRVVRSQLRDASFGRESFVEALKSLHARGFDDGRISVELGVVRQRVAHVRRELGLAPNPRARSVA